MSSAIDYAVPNNASDQSNEPKRHLSKIRFCDIVILFIIGCLLGVFIEGIYCIFAYGRWETHVTYLWGPFNIVYGAGTVAVYIIAALTEHKALFIQFLIFILLATIIEWLTGYIQETFLHSVSWSYEGYAIAKYISIPFSLAWGILGILFTKFLLPPIRNVLSHIKRKKWNILCGIITAFMIVNFIFSMIVLARWGQRSRQPNPKNQVEAWIDEHYPDDYMQQRFVEWKIINPKE